MDDLNKILDKMSDVNNKLKLLNLLKLAQKEYESNNLVASQEYCKKCLEINPKNCIALRGLGRIAETNGKIEIAESYYLEALKYSKKKEIEYTLLGSLFYSINQLEKSIEYYNLAIDANDDYEEAYEGRNQAMLENHLNIAEFQDKLNSNK